MGSDCISSWSLLIFLLFLRVTHIKKFLSYIKRPRSKSYCLEVVVQSGPWNMWRWAVANSSIGSQAPTGDETVFASSTRNSNSAEQLFNTSTFHQRLTCIASTLGGVFSESNQKWATWHSAIFLALSTTGSFHFIDPHHSGDLEGVSPYQLHTWWASVYSLPGAHGRWASHHSGLTFGFAHSGHLRTYTSFLRWAGTDAQMKFCDPVALKRSILERNQWEIYLYADE